MFSYSDILKLSMTQSVLHEAIKALKVLTKVYRFGNLDTRLRPSMWQQITQKESDCIE